MNVLGSACLVQVNVKIICFFRNIFDFLVSLKNQLIKEGLRQDVFQCVATRNAHVLANIESFISFLGI